MGIGAKLKELRLQNDLTLSELASRSEVTKGFLSQLERDLTSPNVSTLSDILEALGTNLQEFFSEKPEEKIVFTKEDVFIDEKDNETIQWIVPNAQKNQMEPVQLILHSHQSTRKIDSHAGEEFGYVLSGRIKLHYGERVYSIKRHETFYVSGRHTHYLENTTDKDASILWISTPPIF